MMTRFDEVLANVPFSKTLEINGTQRVYVFTESDRISAAREIIQREEDAKRRLTAADAEVLLQTVRALLGVVDTGKRNAPAVINAGDEGPERTDQVRVGAKRLWSCCPPNRCEGGAGGSRFGRRHVHPRRRGTRRRGLVRCCGIFGPAAVTTAFGL